MNDTNAVMLRSGNGVVEEMSIAAYVNDLDTKLKFCEILLRSGVAPTSLKSAQAIYCVMLMGTEYGFSPIKSLEMFDFINGRAAMRASAMMAKCTQHGGSFVTLKEGDDGVTVKATRRNRSGTVIWEEEQTYTINDATKAGLLARDNWKKHPKDMCFARAVSRLCRHGWADVLGGLSSAEEMGDWTNAIDVTPTKAADRKSVV